VVQERAVQAISENARRQVHLMDDLLDISRIVAGKVTMEPALIEPGAVVRRAVDTVVPAATAKGLALDVSLGRTLRGVFADPARLQQVVWNLLSNAVKFTPNGGRVSVSVEATDEEVEIVVADNGIGIPAAFLPHAFDRFRQADSRPTRSYGGLGLGLSIVRHLVEAQGGTVRAESEGEGRGATFVVSLPAREFHERRHEEVAETGSRTSVSIVPVRLDNPPSLRRVRVLIVDDDADTRELMAVVLGRHGATVGQAASAVEALEKLACIGADVLLIDLAMPDVDGYTLIRRIRESGGETAGIPAIAVTAYAREEDRRQVLASGFQFHIAKPVESSTLVNAIAELHDQASRRSNASDRPRAASV
jgi:CheY-like chemotaxis protein/anti-sigma regulatory factor (Ser/Thr protein kinase)